MNKNILRRTAAAFLCLCVAAGTLCMTGCGKEVNTYSVEQLAYIDSWLNTSESYGEVTTVNMQNVYSSGTMDVQEIYVTQGQSVKKGDRLMAYNTTLSEIELDKQKLKVMELELALQQAEQELKTVNSYRPMSVTTVVPSASDVAGVKITGWGQLGGTGTEADPFIFVVEGGKIPCSGGFIDNICPPGTEGVWAVYQERKDNMTNGMIIEYWGIRYSNTVAGMTMSFFDASEFCRYVPTEPYEEIEFNSGFTAAEISRMRAAAKERIKEADLEYRLADLEYQQMVLEADGGVVLAQLDGVIEVVAEDPEMAFENGEPLIKLTADGGGYVVQGTLSELELDTVKVGQSVTVTSWESYGEYEASIESISTIPAIQNGWTNGNTNVSYYPFTVRIDGSANLKEYEYVSVRYNSRGETEERFYLERAFVLSENGGSYIFVQTEDGKVEKRRVETGELLWGSYVCILDGLTLEDRIAFPYDKAAKDGATAREAELDELYMY